MKIVSILLPLIISLIPLSSPGNTGDSAVVKTESVSYAKMQFARNLGLVSVGFGRTFINNKISIDLNYGYLPRSINGVRVHTIALKPVILIKKFTSGNIKTGCYIGAGLTYSLTRNTYIKYPDFYPDGYYTGNAFHFNPLIGAAVNYAAGKIAGNKLTLFAEIGTVDYKIMYALHNDEIRFHEIWNLAFGFSFKIK